MKKRPTRTGVSLQMTSAEWAWFSHLIRKVWDKYDVSDDDAAHTILSDLRDAVDNTDLLKVTAD